MACKVLLDEVTMDFMVPWAETHLYNKKGLTMRHVDEEMVEYKYGLCLEGDAAAHRAAEAHELTMTIGYWTKAEECTHCEAADHFTSYHSSYLLSLEVAACNEVDNASAETFAKLCCQARELANQKFDAFRHNLCIETAE